MPAKDCLSLSLRQQADIESANLTGQGRLGYSIDSVLCFSQLAWPIIWDTMSRMGIPDSLLRFWLSGLRGVERWPSFAGPLTLPIRASNGAPESDPLSVAAMCAVCFASHAVVAPTEVQFNSFVDNWAWSQCISQALPLTLAWLEALKLPPDWDKSYAWGTTRPLRVWWATTGAALLQGRGSRTHGFFGAFVRGVAGHPTRRGLASPQAPFSAAMAGSAESPPYTDQHLACMSPWPRVLLPARPEAGAAARACGTRYCGGSCHHVSLFGLECYHG